ncbi:winged helix-turn-helix domain-containing protein [Xanthobacter flavus]|uniref:winged helix-turn-helix domain-containing protein n=1 Tax=Xanthobacter flavus TaxID=281 RepID=UPI00372A51F5
MLADGPTEIEKLRAENRTLRDENVRITRRLRDLETILSTPDVPLCLGLTPREAQVLGVLMARRQVTTQALIAIIYGRVVTAKSVHVIVFGLRRKLAPHLVKIYAEWGCGYYLTDDAKVRVRALA